MTGSTISGPKSYFFKFRTTALTRIGSASIPVLQALIFKSPAIEANCSSINFSGIGRASCTPNVFCAVTATTTIAEYTPRICIVFTSAGIPAPPPLSVPAIVKAWG